MNKAKFSTEWITPEANNNEAWICVCKNTPVAQGFYPCDASGNTVEPDSEWSGLYFCDNCGRIIDSKTLKVVGKRKMESPL
jgi:hypothetical protein